MIGGWLDNKRNNNQKDKISMVQNKKTSSLEYQ